MKNSHELTIIESIAVPFVHIDNVAKNEKLIDIYASMLRSPSFLLMLFIIFTKYLG